MTDNRIEKIRAEIERLKHQSVIDSDRQAERGLQSASMASFGKVKACEELLSFIDSMQKEPKECMYSKDNYTDEDRKVLCGGCEEECKFNKKQEPASEEQVKKSLISKHEDETCKENGNSLTQESVSEYLEKAAEQDVCEAVNTCSAIGIPNDHIPSWVQDAMVNEFIHGAQWKDKQLIAKAVDGILYSTLCGSEQNVVAYVGYGEYGKDGDKVKVIVIKQE